MSFLFGGGDRDRERRGQATERSEEEREQARLEREARRAAREQQDAPAAVRLEDREIPGESGGEIRASRGDGTSPAPADVQDPTLPSAGWHPPDVGDQPAVYEPMEARHVPAELPGAGEPEPLHHDREPDPPDPAARADAVHHHGEPEAQHPPDEVEWLDDARGPEALHPPGDPGQPTAPFAPVPEEDEDPRAGEDPLQPTAAFDPLAHEDGGPDEDVRASRSDPPFEPLIYDPDAAPATPPPHREPPAYAPEADDVPSVVVRGRRDAPSGVRRVSASSVASAAGAQGPPRFGAPPRAAARPRRRRRRYLLLLPLLLILLAAAWVAWSIFQPLAGDDDGERVQVRIPEGYTASQIGDLLQEQGVIDSAFFFSLRTRLSGDRGGLRSGQVDLRRDMSYAGAIDELTKSAPAAPRTIKVTIPEGRSRREVAPIVDEAGLRGSYVRATRRSDELDPRDYGAPRGASLEGFLFPATYDVRPNARASQLVRQQLETFEENFGEVDLTRARRANLSRYDVLIIASMIEREATLAKERRLISAVIYNRLQDGINLGIDATIRYALNQWSSPLKVSELKSDTPYNTRTNPGLPPGPIGSPGLASIKAAANPADSDALFYVVKPCGEGAHAFSETDAQFQRDVAAYNRAREARGGKDPSSC